MTKRRKILLLFAGLGLAFGAYELFREREPTHKGRTLSYWVLRVSPPSDPGDPEAEEAVRQIGDRAVPFLVRWMEYERPDWVIRLYALRYHALHMQPAYDEKGMRAYGAAWAFRFVGPEGKIAVAALSRHLNHPKSRGGAHRAAIALADLQPGSLPALLLGVTNPAPEVRAMCVWAFRLAASNSGPARAALVQGLSDQDAAVRLTAARALGEINTDPALVPPALRNALQDLDAHVRVAATNTLRKIAPELLANPLPWGENSPNQFAL